MVFFPIFILQSTLHSVECEWSSTNPLQKLIDDGKK